MQHTAREQQPSLFTCEMIVQTIKVLFKHLNCLSEHRRLLEMLKLAFVQETGCCEAGLNSPHDLCGRQSDARFLS